MVLNHRNPILSVSKSPVFPFASSKRSFLDRVRAPGQVASPRSALMRPGVTLAVELPSHSRHLTIGRRSAAHAARRSGDKVSMAARASIALPLRWHPRVDPLLFEQGSLHRRARARLATVLDPRDDAAHAATRGSMSVPAPTQHTRRGSGPSLREAPDHTLRGGPIGGPAPPGVACAKR